MMMHAKCLQTGVSQGYNCYRNVKFMVTYILDVGLLL